MKKTYRIQYDDGISVLETDLEKSGGQRYKLDGKPLTGVTTALNVISKPSLIQWSARLCAKEAFVISDKLKKEEISSLVAELNKYPALSTDESKKVAEKFPVFKQAMSAHTNKSDKAKDVGTDAHAWIEEWTKAKMEGKENNEIVLPQDEQILKIVSPFLKWIEGQTPVSTKKHAYDKHSIAIRPKRYKVLASEQSIASKKYWYGGTFDIVLEIFWDDVNGTEQTGKFVVDFKTSSGIYGREYFAQCSAYRNGLEEMKWGAEIYGSLIVRSGKEGDDFEVAMSTEYKADFNLFKAALMIYKEGYDNFDL